MIIPCKSHWQITQKPATSHRRAVGVVTEVDADGQVIAKSGAVGGPRWGLLTTRFRHMVIGESIPLPGNYTTTASARSAVYKRAKQLGYHLSCKLVDGRYIVTRKAARTTRLTTRMREVPVGESIVVPLENYLHTKSLHNAVQNRANRMGRKFSAKLAADRVSYIVTRRA